MSSVRRNARDIGTHPVLLSSVSQAEKDGPGLVSLNPKEIRRIREMKIVEFYNSIDMRVSSIPTNLLRRYAHIVP